MYAVWGESNTGLHSFNLYLLDVHGGSNSEHKVKEEDQTIESTQPEKSIICALCKKIITSNRQKIIKNGSFEHTLFNPQGVVFTLGCFSEASGSKVFGEPNDEFSWFAGYYWNFATCSFCREHLGWFFQSSGGDSFFGLILKKMRGV